MRAWHGRDTRKESQEQSAQDWNNRHRIGVAVTVTRDDGSKVNTVTKSDAYLLGHGQAVILLEGISGCYALDRVGPADEAAT